MRTAHRLDRLCRRSTSMLTELEDHGADLGACHRVDLEAAAVTAAAGVPGGVTRAGPGPPRHPGTDTVHGKPCGGTRQRPPAPQPPSRSAGARSPASRRFRGSGGPAGRFAGAGAVPQRTYLRWTWEGGTAGQRRITLPAWEAAWPPGRVAAATMREVDRRSMGDPSQAGAQGWVRSCAAPRAAGGTERNGRLPGPRGAMPLVTASPFVAVRWWSRPWPGWGRWRPGGGSGGACRW